MKTKWCVRIILLLTLSASLQLRAQVSSTNIFENIKAKAEKGDAKAQRAIGFRYLLGDGVLRDEMEAVKWFHKAAEQNDAEAQYVLGTCYDEGREVRKDQIEAVRWFRKSAEQNFAEGQSQLGYHYEKGIGVVKDEAEAVKWYRKAAEQNDAEAQFLMGYSYHKGFGVPKDEPEAYKWFILAARGNEDGQKCKLALEGQLSPQQIEEGKRRASLFKSANLVTRKPQGWITDTNNSELSYGYLGQECYFLSLEGNSLALSGKFMAAFFPNRFVGKNFCLTDQTEILNSKGDKIKMSELTLAKYAPILLWGSGNTCQKIQVITP